MLRIVPTQRYKAPAALDHATLDDATLDDATLSPSMTPLSLPSSRYKAMAGLGPTLAALEVRAFKSTCPPTLLPRLILLLLLCHYNSL
jgi:hypothetical protein